MHIELNRDEIETPRELRELDRTIERATDDQCVSPYMT
jgi:hypothetical protein